MAVLSLPESFQESYANFPKYPENVILNGPGMYPSTLQSIKSRFNETEGDLCLSERCERDLRHYQVPIRDIRASTENGIDIDKENLHNPSRLSNWLGAHFTSVEKGQVVAHKRDPMCRFIYLYADSSHDRLRITRSSLTEILTYHQVMPVYLDFMSVFGLQSDAKDLKFTGFRTLDLMKSSRSSLDMPKLGRSGRQFQLCYNLKCVALKTKNGPDAKSWDWSIRQSAIHHQFDVIFGTSLWIVTSSHDEIRERFKYMTSNKGREEDRSFNSSEESFRSSLAAHMLYCHWATDDWRGYVLWLEKVVDNESLMAILGSRRPRNARRNYKSGDIQDLQYWLDKTNEAIIILQTNVDVIAYLERFYVGLGRNNDFPDNLKRINGDDITSFAANLEQVKSDFNVQIERAKLLADTIRERKSLVLQHLQSQAAERTEQLNVNLERETLGMRIITIVTLVYLPATFVSTFFSTDIIKYQCQDNEVSPEGSFSTVALKRWLQVTLPLTFLTLLLAFTMYKLEAIKRQPKNEDGAIEDFESLNQKSMMQRGFRTFTSMSTKTFGAHSWIRTTSLPINSNTKSFP